MEKRCKSTPVFIWLIYILGKPKSIMENYYK